MKLLAYNQDSPLGRVFYQVEGDSLTCTSRIGFHRVQREISLLDLQPGYTRTRRRHIGLTIRATLFATGLVWLAIETFQWLTFLYDLLGDGAGDGIMASVAVFFGMLVFPLLQPAFAGLFETDLAIFSDLKGTPALTILQDRRQPERFEEFVTELSRAILNSHINAPAPVGNIQEDEDLPA